MTCRGDGAWHAKSWGSNAGYENFKVDLRGDGEVCRWGGGTAVIASSGSIRGCGWPLGRHPPSRWVSEPPTLWYGIPNTWALYAQLLGITRPECRVACLPSPSNAGFENFERNLRDDGEA